MMQARTQIVYYNCMIYTLLVKLPNSPSCSSPSSNTYCELSMGNGPTTFWEKINVHSFRAFKVRIAHLHCYTIAVATTTSEYQYECF